MNLSDYPDVSTDIVNSKTFSLRIEQFRDIYTQTAYAVSKERSRPTLQGVNFKSTGDSIITTATDSFRLAKKTTAGIGDEFNFTLPAAAMKIVSTVYSDAKDGKLIMLSYNENRVSFAMADNSIEVSSVLLSGGFPETDRLIPSTYMSKLTINREELLRAVDRTKVIKTQDNIVLIRLDMSEGKLVITGKNNEIGECREELSCTYEGEPLALSLDGNLLMDALKATKEDMVQIGFTGKLKAFVVNGIKDNTVNTELINLLLPVRVSEETTAL